LPSGAFATVGHAKATHSTAVTLREGTRCFRDRGGATVTNVRIGERIRREYGRSGALSTNPRKIPHDARFSNVVAVQLHALSIPPGPHGLSEGRGFIDRALAEVGFDEATRYQVTVATNEAVSNAMEHGVPCEDGLFHLTANVESGSFVFSVRDCGEFEGAPSPPPDPVAERGRGFAFMNLLMDDVRLDARAGATVLRLVKRLPGTPAPEREAEPETAEENLRVVRELFDAFAERDAARTTRLVDRGVMLEPLFTPVERRTPYLGVDGLRRYLRDLDETWQEFEVTVEDLRASDGEHVVATGRIYARRDDFLADDPAGFAFRLRDGKIVWAKVYPSHEEALAAVGWS
jgi:ketosteroid isomerase-like protein/anti-sigma regulatory factor (Ser/Thr protein kinase)